jgi:hypothetical protein
MMTGGVSADGVAWPAKGKKRLMKRTRANIAGMISVRHVLLIWDQC